jgi:hypothetical protein
MPESRVRPPFRLLVEALPDDPRPPALRLRAALKVMLRRHRLRAVSSEVIEAPPAATAGARRRGRYNAREHLVPADRR